MVLKPYFHRKTEGPGLKPHEQIGFSAVSGVVLRTTEFGIFVDVPSPQGAGPSVQGLVHISEIKDGHA